MHPVVCVYATFLNRAFDQVLMDVALHELPVTFVLDRAGVTGNDGPSHNGMWDLSLLGVVPGIRVAAPRDAMTLREELAEAVAVDDGPTAQGIAVTVVDPRWVLPVPDVLVGLAAGHQLVVTVSDSGRHGGFGSALADALRAAECDVPQRDLALPQEFLAHGNRADVLAAVGLTVQDVARRVTEWAAALPGAQIGVAAGRGRPRRLD